MISVEFYPCRRCGRLLLRDGGARLTFDLQIGVKCHIGLFRNLLDIFVVFKKRVSMKYNWILFVKRDSSITDSLFLPAEQHKIN